MCRFMVTDSYVSDIERNACLHLFGERAKRFRHTIAFQWRDELPDKYLPHDWHMTQQTTLLDAISIKHGSMVSMNICHDWDWNLSVVCLAKRTKQNPWVYQSILDMIAAWFGIYSVELTELHLVHWAKSHGLALFQVCNVRVYEDRPAELVDIEAPVDRNWDEWQAWEEKQKC